MRNNLLSYALIALSAILLSACASGAKYESMIVSPAPELAAPAKFQNSISLADITGGKETNPMLMSKVSNEAFTKALEMSLQDNGYLAAEGAKGKYVLDAELLGLEQPVMGFSFTVYSIVDYKLTDRKNSVVFEDTIKSAGTGEMGDAFVGVERLRIANEKSVQNNIKSLIETLAAMK